MSTRSLLSSNLAKFSRLVSDAAEILSVEPKIIFDALSEAGIEESEEGVKLLNSKLITEEDLTDSLSDIKAPKLKMKAAVSTLKGYNPYRDEGTEDTHKPEVYLPNHNHYLSCGDCGFIRAVAEYNDRIVVECPQCGCPSMDHISASPGMSLESIINSKASAVRDNHDYFGESDKVKDELSPWGKQLIYAEEKRRKMSGNCLAESIAAGLKEYLPNLKTDFKQLKDKDLLELYIEEKDYEVEQELHRRAKHQPWVVLDPDKKINVEASVDLLKRARKMVNPTLVPIGDTIVPVYRITEINPDDNIVEICPICGGVLYRGYCDVCEVSLSGIGDDERAYLHLISKASTFDKDVYSDRWHATVSASRGIEDLMKTWPSVQKEYIELKLADSLPTFKKVRVLPSVLLTYKERDVPV